MVVTAEVCDYCGSLSDEVEQCQICEFDLCLNDIEAVVVEDPHDIIMVCNLCTARYYQREEIESYN